MGQKSAIHVAVAAIVDNSGRVLIAQRPKSVHLGGCWEFPGGKVEPGEDILQALRREVAEELGVEVVAAEPLIRIPYQYPDREVLLDVWRVLEIKGDPCGREGQAIAWAEHENLTHYDFPPANKPIVTALGLPRKYLITPECQDAQVLLAGVENAFSHGVRLIQLRAHGLCDNAFVDLANQVAICAKRSGAQLIVNTRVDLAQHINADGVHLTSERAAQYTSRPVSKSQWLSCSVHTERELLHAHLIGADFVSISPVYETATHPGAVGMGWAQFKALVAQAAIPVYALGGLSEKDLGLAIEAGAQGVAAIRGFWPEVR